MAYTWLFPLFISFLIYLRRRKYYIKLSLVAQSGTIQQGKKTGGRKQCWKKHIHTKALIKSVRKRHIQTYKHTQQKNTQTQTHMSTSPHKDSERRKYVLCIYQNIYGSLLLLLLFCLQRFEITKKKTALSLLLLLLALLKLFHSLAVSVAYSLLIFFTPFYQQPFASITTHNVFTFFSLYLGMSSQPAQLYALI